MDLAQLKEAILTSEPEDFVNDHIMNGQCRHVRQDQIDHIRLSVSRATGVNILPDEVYVVGSAKIGFGLFEKKRKGRPTLPAFREFTRDSDVDVAFASAELFDLVWDELSSFAASQPWMPSRFGSLGDYLVYGWLRPDHFPKEARLHRYDRWNDKIKTLGSDRVLNRRKISGALYRNAGFITKYQARGIKACKRALEVL